MIELCRHFARAVPAPESDVQVWMAALDSISPNELKEARALLDATEQARAAQFYFERDRCRFVATRALLRRLLGIELNTAPGAIAFAYGTHGKPEIAPNEGRQLRFNLSHAGGFALFAVAWDRKLGIDLETSENLKADIQSLAARILSVREVSMWRELPNEAARKDALLRAWTRKEAYIKGSDENSLDDLQKIEVALDAAAPRSSLTVKNWMIYDLAAPAGFSAALAIEQNQSRDRA